MADRMIDPTNNEPQGEITDELKAVVQAVLNEAVAKMEAGEEIIPFTGLAVKENLFIETHPGDDAETCFMLARREVEGARGATAYAFCYDGYLDTEAGTKDCIIAEGGLPGAPEAYAFGYIYDEDGINKDIVYIGPAPNFMEGLKLELDIEGTLDPRDALKESLDEEGVGSASADQASSPEDASEN